MKVLVIANPMSGRFNLQLIEQVKSVLAAKFSDVSIVLTEKAGQGGEIARSSSADFVIAAGGDGLANEVAQGIVGTQKLFSVLPFGTVNVFCREYGIPLDPVKASEKFDVRVRRVIDVGYLDERLFLLMAGFGFDAETVRRVVSSGKKHKFKSLAHVISGISVLLKNRFNAMHVFLSGTDTKAYHLVVAVAGSYAGKYQLGKIVHGKLNLFAITNNRLWSLFKSLLALFRGDGFVGVRAAAEYVKVSGASCCQLDGEYMPLSKSSVFLRIKRGVIRLVR